MEGDGFLFLRSDGTKYAAGGSVSAVRRSFWKSDGDCSGTEQTSPQSPETEFRSPEFGEELKLIDSC